MMSGPPSRASRGERWVWKACGESGGVAGWWCGGERSWWRQVSEQYRKPPLPWPSICLSQYVLHCRQRGSQKSQRGGHNIPEVPETLVGGDAAVLVGVAVRAPASSLSVLRAPAVQRGLYGAGGRGLLARVRLVGLWRGRGGDGGVAGEGGA